MAYYWIGLETADSPNGLGEDCREYVSFDDDDPNGMQKLHDAVLRQAAAVTQWRDGSRIAVRRMNIT